MTTYLKRPIDVAAVIAEIEKKLAVAIPQRDTTLTREQIATYTGRVAAMIQEGELSNPANQGPMITGMAGFIGMIAIARAMMNDPTQAIETNTMEA